MKNLLLNSKGGSQQNCFKIYSPASVSLLFPRRGGGREVKYSPSVAAPLSPAQTLHIPCSGTHHSSPLITLSLPLPLLQPISSRADPNSPHGFGLHAALLTGFGRCLLARMVFILKAAVRRNEFALAGWEGGWGSATSL